MRGIKGACEMRQLHCEFNSEDQLLANLLAFESDINGAASYYFQFFSANLNDKLLNSVIEKIKRVYPDATIIGATTAGNVVNSASTSDVSITLNIFEDETSRFEIIQYDFATMGMDEIGSKVKQEAEKRSWVKAIEIYHTVAKVSTSTLCDAMSEIDTDIAVFGGIVCSPDLASSESYIYSDGYGMCDNGLLCLLLGGDNLHIEARKISGWKPIGRTFRVTRSRENVLYELSGIPAYEVYQRYLNIRNDENFFINALEFPIMYEHNNTTIIRASAESNDDGSIRMSSNIEEGSIVRLSYGEPNTIVKSVQEGSLQIKDFQPQALHIFTCAARKTFWDGYDPAYELKALKSICSGSGFFSHGEFLREHDLINQHNLTLVIAYLREGEKQEFAEQYAGENELDVLNTKLPLAARMATFIRETSYELEQINSHLEVMNQQLQGVVTKDSLTGLDNRLAFDEMMNNIASDVRADAGWTMYMFDVNGLKYINDTFGHLAGDELIVSAANIIKESFGDAGHYYRIGGDEFVALVNASTRELKDYDDKLEDCLRKCNKESLYRLSMAIGQSKLIDNFGNRKSISNWKMDADLSMYRSKSLSRKERRSGRDENLQQLIACLISVEEAKDPYTAYHSDRVCCIAKLLAKQLGLTEESIDVIADAAALHDIGKVGISDSVLLKPGKLTDNEFEQIKEHPIIGARILMQSNYMQDIVQIVLHHHERYDGKGYPDGIEGSDIPIGARIIALADSIDAMSSKRIYRNAIPLDKCRDEILANVGKMYDPAIARIAINSWDEIERIIMEHPKYIIK
ncbi:MAG: diguanylate cyclase [Eubacterium sp.]|nr:diguanylate cyclase [Candidatus Colimonas fimequi]